jgi:hypothetical protein
MDKLKELLQMDPCYEQHIVSIREIYEDHLFSILIPAIYEGLQSIYKNAYEIELKYIKAAKKTPEIENPGILVIFQKFLKDIPNLNTHIIRNETDRIKSSSKSADIFEDLIKAVCKANIILLTYNIDHKRKELIRTKYHENIIIHDFIHACYIHSARMFFGCAELFYHNQEPIILNQNKRTCYNIIRDAIKEAIRLMLPMKEILLEYITQKYEQKETSQNILGMGSLGQMGQMSQMGQMGPNQKMQYMNNVFNKNQEEFNDANNMIERDLMNHRNHSILEDDYDPNDQNIDEENAFGQDMSPQNNNGRNDFSLLISETSDANNTNDTKDSILEYKGIKKLSEEDITMQRQHNSFDADKESVNSRSTDSKNSVNILSGGKNKHDNTEKNTEKNSENLSAASDHGLKYVDIKSTLAKKGPVSSYFGDMMPVVKQKVDEYKKNRKLKKSSPDNNKDKIINNKNDQDIQITRTISDNMSDNKQKKEIDTNKLVDNVLKS